MKKVVVFFIVAMVVFGACSAQKADAQSANYAQRIIGTWTEQGGSTWVFNANGTGNNGRDFKFAVAETKLAISIEGTTFIGDISISSDGKTLLIILKEGGRDAYFWLTKK